MSNSIDELMDKYMEDKDGLEARIAEITPVVEKADRDLVICKEDMDEGNAALERMRHITIGTRPDQKIRRQNAWTLTP